MTRYELLIQPGKTGFLRRVLGELSGIRDINELPDSRLVVLIDSGNPEQDETLSQVLGYLMYVRAVTPCSEERVAA